MAGARRSPGASGNVILSSRRAPSGIKRQIERALPMRFRLDSELIAVRVMTHAELRAVVDHKPQGFGERPGTFHSDAIFLIGIDAATAMEVFDPHPQVDRVWPGEGVIYSQRLSAQRTKSRLNKAITTPLNTSMTIRSWSTTALVVAQPLWLGQAVANLVGNAARYSQPGGPVTVTIEGEGASGVLVRVLDSGPGLGRDVLEHVFEPFYRAPGASQRAPGTGLGLTVAKRIVESSGGRIWARSRPDGTEFGFALPLMDVEDV